MQKLHQISHDSPTRRGASIRERCQCWRLCAQLFGTGPRWRPLGEAFAVHWHAAAWRQELIQQLALLAECCERCLHPLPWALPVPLRVHGRSSRAEIMAATGSAAA